MTMSEEWYKFQSKNEYGSYQYLFGTLEEAIDLAEIRNTKPRSTLDWWKNGCKVSYVDESVVRRDREALLDARESWAIRDRITKEK